MLCSGPALRRHVGECVDKRLAPEPEHGSLNIDLARDVIERNPIPSGQDDPDKREREKGGLHKM